MKFHKIFVFALLVMLVTISYGQNPGNPILQQWTNKDAAYNAPQNGNPLLSGYYADPTVIEDNGTFYIYATSDLTSWDAITKLGVWRSTDLKNWTCIYLNWPTKEQCVSNTGRKDGVWAPSVVKARNGKFYMYVTVGREIWVGVADAPAGPWKNARADNQPLIRQKEYYYVETIDAECFIDNDGQAYLYWGSTDLGFDIEGRCLAVKLNADMSSFSDAPRDVTPPHYFEAPYMLKRANTYYLMYSWGHTWDKTYQVRYATGNSPFGPWQEGDVRPLLVANENDERLTSTGHHTVLHYGNKYYIIYHRFNTLNRKNISAKLRQICADEMTFNQDSSLQHVVATHKGISFPFTNKEKNIAFGAKTKSSSDLDTVCKATYATDENNGTLWIGGKSANEWLQVDFERTVFIERIEVFTEFPIYPYQYKIEISGNGKDWTNVDDGMKNTKIGSPIVVQKKLQAGFVRVTMANNKKGPRPGIWELKVF
jgi:arabinoxylan arabinofuranohydrolase